jgi:hypothetical protein
VLQLCWNIGLAVFGTIYLFHQNSGLTGTQFFQRYFAIGWAVGLRWLAWMLPLYVLLLIAGIFERETNVLDVSLRRADRHNLDPPDGLSSPMRLCTELRPTQLPLNRPEHWVLRFGQGRQNRNRATRCSSLRLFRGSDLRQNAAAITDQILRATVSTLDSDADHSTPSTGAFATSPSLLERARGNDADAWKRIVSLYGPLVDH